MYSVLTMVFSIVLMSIIATMTVNHIPIDALIAKRAREQAIEGYQALGAGAGRYILSVKDAEGVIHLPPPGQDLANVLAPGFVFIPQPPKRMDWSIQTSSYLGMQAIAICLFPKDEAEQPEKAAVLGATQARNFFPPAAIFVSSHCNATSNSDGGRYTTYWVLAAHHS
ncbi:hypothetical protein [Acidovorax sp.]|uniref:hypothetical protein n=1 Tax=Acidovorax sp. TaxID=1872122 RepID=UPI00391F5565